MKLQDLKDDLAQHGIGGHHPVPPLGQGHGICWADRVARRVADLYDECPIWTDDGEGYPARCPRCGGTGVALRADTLGRNAVTLTLADDGITYISLRELARYLFGGNT